MERFATLVESCFDDPDKETFVARESGDMVASEADDSRLDLRGRVEDRLADREKIFDIVES